jgi:hypothetical protein
VLAQETKDARRRPIVTARPSQGREPVAQAQDRAVLDDELVLVRVTNVVHDATPLVLVLGLGEVAAGVNAAEVRGQRVARQARPVQVPRRPALAVEEPHRVVRCALPPDAHSSACEERMHRGHIFDDALHDTASYSDVLWLPWLRQYSAAARAGARTGARARGEGHKLFDVTPYETNNTSLGSRAQRIVYGELAELVQRTHTPDAYHGVD